MEIIELFEFRKLKIPSQVAEIIETSAINFLNTITKYISTVLTNLIQGLTKIPIVMIYILITILSTYFICTDRLYMLDQLEHHLPKTWVKKIGVKVKKIISTLTSYLKAEILLIFISFLIILTGLYILKFLKFQLDFPLLIALGIGFVDALPILRCRNSYCTMGYNF